jgi:hypothetical protein
MKNMNIYKFIFCQIILTISFLLGVNPINAQTVTAPEECIPTPDFPEGSLFCGGAGFVREVYFFEDFDNGFGVFTEDAPINAGTSVNNDLTVSTNGETPSFGTGPELTAGCNGNFNDGEFIFLEGSFTRPNEIHCMSTDIDLTNASAPLTLSFWYHMFGSNIGTLEVFVNNNSEFILSGQQQTENGQPWEQGTADLSGYAGQNITLRICMSEGNGAISSFESDISIDYIEIVGACRRADGIPTMNQWALFLFGLIVFTVFVVGIYNVYGSSSLLRKSA